MMRKVHVLGVGLTAFGKFPEISATSLGRTAVMSALKDAAIEPREIQAAYTARLYSDMIAGQTILAGVGIADVEMANVENACAGGGTAVRMLWKDIAAGFCEVGIAIGVESISRSPVAGKLIPPAEDDLDGMLGLTMPVVFALQAKRLMETHGARPEDFARVSAKSHDFAALNPFAQYRKRVTPEEVLASRMIADPITLLQCCPTSDGAAAIVLCSAEYAGKHGRHRSVEIAASVLLSGDFSFKKEDLTSMRMGTKAARLAYEAAGIGPEDLDVVELHDAFAPEENLHYEDLGLCPRGGGVDLLRSGATSRGGRIPVNPSGGLLSLGHPLSASGVRNVCEIALQLRGAAGERQVPGAKTGLAQMLGGAANTLESGAVTVHVLKA